MHRRRLVGLLVPLWSGLALTMACTSSIRSPATRVPVPGAPTSVTALVNVAVVPMDIERVLPNHTVLVVGGWITALGPSDQLPVPAGATRIDGRGKYLIPGLADMHTHIFSRVAMERKLLGMLMNGVTTIRNMDYADENSTGTHNAPDSRSDGELLLQVRARAAAGEIVSPRIYTSGQWAPPQYTNVWSHPMFLRPTNPPKPRLDSVAAYVAAYKAAGYDHIKNYFEQGELFDSLAAAARRVGLPLVGHLPDSVPLERALASMKSSEHLFRYLPWKETTADAPPPSDSTLAAVAAIARRATNHWVCPSVGLLSTTIHRRLLVKPMHDAGVKFLFCTDNTGDDTPTKSPAHELQTLVKVGLTPYQALVTGTRNPAQYFGTLDSVGTITVGKRADLVLLNGNPLQDIRHAAQPAGVMLGGRWLPRAELKRRVLQCATAEQLAPILADLDSVQRGRRWVSRQQLLQLEVQTISDALKPDSFPLALSRGSGADYERLSQLIAQQLGHLRAALTPAQQAVFDPKVRAWLQVQQRARFRVAIPGIQP